MPGNREDGLKEIRQIGEGWGSRNVLFLSPQPTDAAYQIR